MSDEHHHVENEIEDHKSDLEKWITDIRKLSVPESRQGVVDRFVRDCDILKSDLEEKETPQSADLVDFTDRRNSLEIQYHHIVSDLQ